MSAEEQIVISDFDKDSLHLLPLAIPPLQSRALLRARLVKNARLQSMLEVFESTGSGSGQIDPEMIDLSFDIAKDTDRDDARIVQSLARMNSFDV